ncbi:hypothetical protein Ancab_028480 [Ancistrocladus abbreviatus]
MKTVLQKSFKPAKCKTALKLAVSRMKLLKNKKEVQLKQLKREVAQLLQSGQDQTARIRVEHVIREEKTMAAYDLIEIYCELIVARLSMIESQKNCPIDLKEAIASIIFASPRCADIPELVDVRKHITARYGKEFVTAAMELRPECGVNRIMVEKLSAIAPDGPTKVRILTAIANEHNIKWEPDWSKDRDEGPPGDLLHKVNVDKANKTYVEPPSYEAGPTIERRHDVTANVYDTVRTGENSSKFASTDIGARTAAETMMFNYSPNRVEDAFSVGMQGWNMEFKDATAAAQAAAESAERASMAARVAAELSSRGRVAKHGSTSYSASVVDGWIEGNKVNAGTTMQRKQLERNSTNNYIDERSSRFQHEQRELNDGVKLTGGAGEVSLRNKYDESSSEIQVEQRDLNDQAKSTGGAAEVSLKNECTRSLKQCESKQEDNTFLEGYHFVNGGMRKQSKVSHTAEPEGSNHEFGTSASSNCQAYQYASAENPFYEETVDIRNQSSSSHSQSTALDKEYGIFSNLDHHSYGNDSEEPYVGFNQGNVYGGEQKVGEQSQNPSSHSGIFYEENNDIFHYVATKHGIDSGEDPFLVLKQGSVKVESKQSDINAYTAVVFDESGSDDGDYMLDLDAKHDTQNYPSDIPSPSSKWSTHFSLAGDESPTNGGIESPFSSRHLYRPEITESFGKSSLSSQLGKPLPLAFDDSDGPNSESGEEEEPPQSKMGKRIGSRILHADSQEPELPSGTSHKLNAPSSAGKRTSRFSSGSVDANEHFEDHGTKFDAVLRTSLGSGDWSTSPPSPRHLDSRSGTNEFDPHQSVSSLVDGLNQQSLETVRLMSQGSRKSMQSTTDSGSANELSVKSAMDLNFGLLTGGLRNKGYNHPPYRRDPSSDSSSSSRPTADITSSANQQPTSPASSVQEPTAQNLSTKINNKSRIRVQHAHVDSVDNDFGIKLVQKDSGIVQEPDDKTIDRHVDKRSSLRGPAGFFDSDDSSAEEDVPRQTVTRTGYSGSGFSRRTRDTVPRSVASSYSSSVLSSEASDTADHISPKKPSAARPHATQPLPMPQTRTTGSGLREGSVQARWREQATSRRVSQSKILMENESSAKEKMTGPSKDSTSGGSATEVGNTSSSTKTISRANSEKRVGHVHPKLPDYDTLAAHMLSLRMNRQ